MKYMERGSFQYHPLMRLTLGGMLVMLSGLWISNFGMYFSRMSLRPASVAAYYLGDEANYSAPRTFSSMVETSHGHFAMMAMVLLVLTHLAIFIPVRGGYKLALILATFAAAAVDELSGWAVRFIHPGFAWCKPPAFLLLQLCQLILLGSLAMFLWHAARQQRESALAAEPERPRRRRQKEPERR